MEIENVAIYDILGRLVGAYPCGRPNSAKGLKRESANGAITIDVSHLSSGVYIVQCRDEINRVLTGKFVKK
jgi:hypothetical protein